MKDASALCTSEQADIRPLRAVNGRFVPGLSGNPGGRPKTNCEIQKLCQSYTEDAVNCLYDLMQNAPPGIQLLACREILDRAYGKAFTQNSVEASEPLSIRVVIREKGVESESIQQVATWCKPKV